MGMYDDLLIECEYPELTCAEGHAIKSFQTKDLDCCLENYVIRLDYDTYKLFKYQSWYETELGSRDAEVRKNLPLKLEEITRMINVYGSCGQCAIYTGFKFTTKGDPGVGIGKIDTYNEFEIFVKKGVVQCVEAMAKETLQEVKARCLKQGNTILENNDPRVLEYIAKYHTP